MPRTIDTSANPSLDRTNINIRDSSQMVSCPFCASTDSVPVPMQLLDSLGDSLIVIRRGFNHKEQVMVSGIIMSCLALMLVTMNNYNPR